MQSVRAVRKAMVLATAAAAMLTGTSRTASADSLGSIIDVQGYFGCWGATPLITAGCAGTTLSLFASPGPLLGSPTVTAVSFVGVPVVVAQPGLNLFPLRWSSQNGTDPCGIGEVCPGARGETTLPLTVSFIYEITNCPANPVLCSGAGPYPPATIDQLGSVTLNAIVTPEPTTIALMAPALLGLAGWARRKKRRDHAHDSSSSTIV